jgi:chemotaxis protein MotB
MAGQSNAPVIIKRKKVVGGDGHHGGAWKVAYADFVTAMMAFFMLRWLLNATTEKQRKGIADYFSPTIPINRISGGGDGAFGGTSVFSEELLAEVGDAPMEVTGTPTEVDPDGADGEGTSPDTIAFGTVAEALMGQSGESMASDEVLRHIVTRVTDEGLIIEIFSLDASPLFVGRTLEPTDIMLELTDLIAGLFELVENQVSVEGHVKAQPVVVAENRIWSLSQERANKVRGLLELSGLDAERIQRVTGHADRDPAARNPLAMRNDRIEIILLRGEDR